VRGGDCKRTGIFQNIKRNPDPFLGERREKGGLGGEKLGGKPPDEDMFVTAEWNGFVGRRRTRRHAERMQPQCPLIVEGGGGGGGGGPTGCKGWGKKRVSVAPLK